MIRRMAAESEEIGKALKCVIDKINFAAQQRPQTLPCIHPRLVAVTKTKPVSAIIAAYQQGQRHFGENYVQELEEKSRNMKILEHCKDIKWHFIGHLQRNKSGKVTVVPNLYMVETVDSQKLAQTLNNHWEKYKRPGKLNIMVQVNTSLEQNKSGCERSEMCALAKFVREKCPCLQFVGLMTIGAVGYNPADGPNPDFLRLVECRQELCKELNLELDEVELSMGMSSDYEHAIQLGSTNVRVGSTIFGARDYGPKTPSVVDPPPSSDTQSNSPKGASTLSGQSGDTNPGMSVRPDDTDANTSCDKEVHSTGELDSTSDIALSDSVNRLNVEVTT